MKDSLAVISKARQALAQAKDMTDVLEIKDKAEAIRKYLRAAGEGLEAQNAAAEIKLRAERKLGEMLWAINPNSAAKLESNTVLLSDLGITKMQSSRWQKIASLTADVFDDTVRECNEDHKELTQALMLRKALGAHVASNAGDNEWYTPAEYIGAARAVMGTIDLDPASSQAANEVVEAEMYYSDMDNGLDKSWAGNVWMNPPYAQPLISQFCAKLAESFRNGDVSQAITLTNNATETAWCQDLLSVSTAVCMPKGRVKFWAPGKVSYPLQGQIICYLGAKPAAFCKAFSCFGFVSQAWRKR